MRVQVQLFGGFQVVCDGAPVANLGLTERRVLVQLCLAEAGCTRRQLGETLWPGIDYSSSGNRIRTALVGLRRAFENVDPFLADRQQIALNPGLVVCDVWQAQDAERNARHTFDSTDRQLVLKTLVESTSLDLLPGWDENWAAAAREYWASVHESSCVRLAESACSTSDWSRAAEWASAALDRQPESAPAWSIWFTSMGRLGRGPEAARRFFVAQKAHGLRGEAWSNLVSAARFVRGLSREEESEFSLNLNETELLRRAFGRMVQDDPAAAARFLSHPLSGQEIDHEPTWIVGLIDRLIVATKGMPEEALARTFAIRAHGLIDDRDTVREHANWILVNDDDDSRRLGTLQVMTFIDIADNNWELALAHQNEALEIATRLGEKSRYCKGLAQLGNILWHMGRGKEALAAYADAYDYFSQNDPAGSSPVLARAAYGTALVLATRGDEIDAEPWIQRSKTFAEGSDAAGMATFLDPLAGYVAAVHGHPKKASQCLSQGIAASIRRSDQRSLEVAFDFAAAAFAVWGKGGLASALLDLVQRLRDLNGRPRTVGESAFAVRIRRIADSNPDAAWLKLDSVAAIARAVLAELESGH